MQTKKNVTYRDINLNFEPHPVTGDITTVTDVSAITQSLKSLILTQFNSKKFNPDVGSGVGSLLFEPMNNITALAIHNSIEVCITNWEPRVELASLTIDPDYDSNVYNVTISFYVLNEPTKLTLTLTLTRVA